jgi:quercetin dioxygenase-like cupin family protein
MIDVVIPDEAEAFETGTEAMTGPTRVLNLTPALGTSDLQVIMVYFDKGSRSRPHIHHRYDQILYYVSGEGVVAVSGEADVIVPEGGFVRLPEGQLHMHGASDKGPATHLSILVDVDLTFDVDDVPEEWRQFAKSTS